MRKIIFLILLFGVSNKIVAQPDWFHIYTDSTALVLDGNSITTQFIKDVKKINPKINFDVKAVLNTTPYLIYYDGSGPEKTANMPLWSQVISPIKQFFYEMAGDEVQGKLAFGYFFNGFYLPHELAHALQDVKEGNQNGSYKNELFANTLAILWWRKQGREKELKLCYESAKKMWQKLPNPIPTNSTIEDFFNQNYEQASQDPSVYGYMQFKQFIQVYEDKTLPSFDEFVSNYLSQK
ncbi:hypothetical protein L1S34_07160 [Flavobacterium sp. K77]|uniref:hypothetical protein n=1 Tax=Flavobacterium sp. K77 TaxID=2910676 RepID=UPI001F29DD44|nr:hypothetical protein [Flavobacterium sp. K77]MCF6141059.1 hypothetical protein [Flavobacterium sp. K77]